MRPDLAPVPPLVAFAAVAFLGAFFFVVAMSSSWADVAGAPDCAPVRHTTALASG